MGHMKDKQIDRMNDDLPEEEFKKLVVSPHIISTETITRRFKRITARFEICGDDIHHIFREKINKSLREIDEIMDMVASNSMNCPRPKCMGNVAYIGTKKDDDRKYVDRVYKCDICGYTEQHPVIPEEEK